MTQAIVMKAYIYKEGILTPTEDVQIDVRQFRGDDVLSEAIKNTGFKPISEVPTMGGLWAKVYQRNPAHGVQPLLAFTGYDFLIEVAKTYLIGVSDLNDFLTFSYKYLVPFTPIDNLKWTFGFEFALVGISNRLDDIAKAIKERQQ